MSLETFVKTGERPDRLPEGLPAEMTEQAAGALVSLHTHGQLRVQSALSLLPEP